MLELDSTLAQLIVDRAMAILPHNINVMDAQGMIIGSGDPSRLPAWRQTWCEPAPAACRAADRRARHHR